MDAFDILRKMDEDERKAAQTINCRRIQLDEYTKNRSQYPEAYIWAQGIMRRVSGLRPDWWVVTGEGWETSSWCCHGGSNIWVKI